MRFALFFLLLSITVRADQLTIPNELSNNTVANADAVKANFDALAAESNENDTRIGTLETNVRRDDTDFNLAVGSGLQNLTPDSQSDLTASYNTAVGIGALDGNTTGYLNTAVGINALSLNSTGGFNSAFGNGALYSNEVGTENTATGSRAAYSGTSASYVVAVGREALSNNTVGDGNTAIGFQSLGQNVTGSYNTAVGRAAGVASDGLSNATAIGNEAQVDASNKIQLGNDQVDSVATAGKLTTGAVTYPNTDGQAGEVLTTDGNGVAGWSDSLSVLRESISYVTAEPDTSISAAVCPSPQKIVGGGCAGTVQAGYPEDGGRWTCVSAGGNQVTAYAICL